MEYLKGKLFLKVAVAKDHTVVLGADGEVIPCLISGSTDTICQFI